jgi:hypothetical protein
LSSADVRLACKSKELNSVILLITYDYFRGVMHGISRVNIVTDLINALRGKSSVNKNRSNNRRESVFCGVRAAIVAMQWFGKHVSTIEAVLSAGPCRGVILKQTAYSDSDSTSDSDSEVQDRER